MNDDHLHRENDLEEDSRFEAPFERAFDKIATPIEEFIHYRVNEGLTLAASAIMSFALVNSPLADAFAHLLHAELAVTGAPVSVHMSFHHWVNDGLMTLFFLLMGLEIKRELLVGELSSFRKALAPIIGAIGGMVIPAVIFYAFNPTGEMADGWGIPMATDIAFALGVLTLLGHRIPRNLFVFLVSLAIVDDIGAVLVIALFYTASLKLGWLLGAGAITLTLIALNLMGIRKLIPFGIVGGLLWFALLESGVHATIGGVILAFTIPVRPRFNPARFSRKVRELADEFDRYQSDADDILVNDRQAEIAQEFYATSAGALTPLQQLERGLHLPVAFLVMPLFALMNAGIPLDAGRLVDALTHPVTLGVFFGLLVGKVVGILGGVALAVRIGWIGLPVGVTLSHIFGASLLGGIGFTMSVFVADLAYVGEGVLLDFAKMGIVAASLVAGAGGALWLYRVGSVQAKT